ncbi:thiamine pyrophosphate-binding protein [Anoxynatronum buryatiense]|uniref:Acetolactate synthase-1/2/3 large subunit n=1 Tax=Anoxynatronum buryatiense TaxID=489973 RepID=A0AA46AI64_9CLOT|nr:thiamine pyrophosphate-binding protein [Anoxynatronum buryatiense]SMP45649.1 acetolactate synthase-1/2/3 large subunit [Anoxynatronum buryatiense]
MAKVDGGRLFAKALKKEGVECVFTLSGGHIMPILYGCREEGIRVIDVRHESTGGYAAEAYAKVTGKPGILVTTAGPGITNATTPMAEAAETGIPVIHIGGGSPIRENDTGPLQNVKSFEAMAVFCKWARKIYNSSRVPEYVAMAFRHAYDDTPGPVYLEIAADVLFQQFEEDEIYWPERYRAFTTAYGDPRLVEQAAEALIQADKPAMIIGETARFSQQEKNSVEKLANYLKIPVFSQTTSRGVYADERTNELFRIGEGAIREADVVLELGVDHSYKIGKGKAPRVNGAALRIMVHPDLTKIGYNVPADIGIVAGAGAASDQIFEMVKAKTKPIQSGSWTDEARELTKMMRKPFLEAAVSTILPTHPGRVAAEVAKYIETEATDWHVICDGGDAASWIDANATASYPGQVVRYGPLGTIGTGQGYSLGAWAADGKPVLYYTGDGSFGFYSMEFETFVRNNIPLVCVISNDSAWGMIKLSEEAKRPDYISENGHLATTLPEMFPYEKMAALWGGVGIRVDHYDDIIPAIRKVRSSGKPGIINVDVDKIAMAPATAAFAGVKQK